MVKMRATSCNKKASLCENNSEFFKVYLPCFSSQQLDIPPAFVWHVNGTIPRTVILKDHAGRQWHGRIEEVKGGLVIKNGWESFASQHSLEYGDLLIFKYNGDSLFDVKIFGKSGCIKEETLIANVNTTRVKTEDETQAEQNSSRAGHACEQKYSETVFKRTANAGGSSGTNGFKTVKKSVTYLGESRAFDSVGYVIPKNPHFVSTIVQSTAYCLSVSVPVVESHGIKLKPDIMLCDQNGDKWPVKVAFRLDGRIALTTGWIDFRRRKCLKTGDKCVFEFVLSRGNICKEMKVQVVHAGVASPKSHRRH